MMACGKTSSAYSSRIPSSTAVAAVRALHAGDEDAAQCKGRVVRLPRAFVPGKGFGDAALGVGRCSSRLHSTLLTLAMTGYTLCEVSIIFDPGPRGRRFRHLVVSQIRDHELKNYWAWYDSQTAKEQSDVAAPIMRPAARS